MLNYPLTQYMFCSPDEGAAAVVLCRAENAHRYTDTPIYLRADDQCARGASARSRCTARGCRSRRPSGPTVDASRAAYEMAGIGPEDVDVIQLQDTDAGAEVIHLAENGFCADGEQEALVADGAIEIGGRLPVNTDGGLIANGEPIGASGPAPGARDRAAAPRRRPATARCPGNPKVGYTQLYGAPGTAGVSILSVCAADDGHADTTEQAELRRSARQLAHASSGRHRSPISTTRRTRERLRAPCATRAGSSCATTRRRRPARERSRGRDRGADALGGAVADVPFVGPFAARGSRRPRRHECDRLHGGRVLGRAHRHCGGAGSTTAPVYAIDAADCDEAYLLVPEGDGFRLARAPVAARGADLI